MLYFAYGSNLNHHQMENIRCIGSKYLKSFLLKDYKLILNSLIDTAPEYIFFTAQTFYEKRINKKEKIIVKQVNIHASQNHHLITIVLCSTDIT